MLYMARMIAARINELSKNNLNADIRITTNHLLAGAIKKINEETKLFDDYRSFQNILAQYNLGLPVVEPCSTITFKNKANADLPSCERIVTVSPSLFLGLLTERDRVALRSI